MTSNVVDFEEILNNGFSDSNTTVRSGVHTRWERKKLQTDCDSSDCGDKRKGASNSDRFIPNRAAMDLDKSANSLLKRCVSYDESVAEVSDVGGSTVENG